MSSTAKEDILVFITHREGTCADCGRELLMKHGDRQLARQEVYTDIGRVLRQWEAPAGSDVRPGMEPHP